MLRIFILIVNKDNIFLYASYNHNSYTPKTNFHFITILRSEKFTSMIFKIRALFTPKNMLKNYVPLYIFRVDI